MEAEKDTDWFFDWPTGYVRYRNGRREALQDRDKSPSRPLLTDAERAALHWFAHYGLPEARAATLRGLLERLA